MLPSNVQYCTVKGRFLRAIGDGSDAGREPDAVPIEGLTITISADLKPAITRNATSTPPVTIFLEPIICTTDADGVLLGPDGSPDVLIVASDDEDLDPHDWTYKVTLQSMAIGTVTFSFVAPVGETVDLSSVVPVPPSPGADIPAWTVVATAASTARDEAVAASVDAAAAAAAVQAVEATNDGIMTAVVEDAESSFSSTLSSKIGDVVAVVNVAQYESAQAALDAAPDGARVFFPQSVSPVTVPQGGLVLKSQNLTIDAMGCEFEVSHWGTPAFLALRSNGGADGNTYRIGLVRYVGTRGDHTGTTLRGSAPYCSGCGVWTNGDRNFIEYLRTDGMPTPIFYASWDGTGTSDRTGVGNRIGYLEAESYNFALLYVKQEAFDWGNAYCHDDLDDSGGANPTHAIYCSASTGHRSGAGTLGRWYTERNLGGQPYLFKFQDKLTADALVAHDSRGVFHANSCDDLTVSTISGTEMRNTGSDRQVTFAGAEFSNRAKIGRIYVHQATGANSEAVNVLGDDCEIGSITVDSNHVSGISPAVSEVQLRGSRGSVGSIRVAAHGVGRRPVTLATPSDTWSLPHVRTSGSGAAYDDVPVQVVAASHSNRWGDGGGWLADAAPNKGSFTRGMRWRNAVSATGQPRGWTCTTSGALSGATWAASTAVTAQAWVRLADGRVVRYLTAGTTGAAEPNPTMIGATGTDGTATWEYMSATSGAVVSEGNL